MTTDKEALEAAGFEIDSGPHGAITVNGGPPDGYVTPGPFYVVRRKPQPEPDEAERIVDTAIRKVWSETGDEVSKADTAQMIDRQWRMAPWGCDSLDRLRDELIHGIRAALAARAAKEAK